MSISRSFAVLGLGAALAIPVLAQTTDDHANDQARKELKTQARQDHKADKAQAKADKANEKALGSHKVKKAAKDQDRANAQQPQ